MKGLSTEEIMDIALELVGWSDVPLDSGIHVPGKNIRRLIYTMDANVGLLHMAKELGFDAVLCHHPCGVLLRQGEVYRRHIDLLEQHGVGREQALKALGESIDTIVLRLENNRFRMLYNESPNKTVLEVDAARLLNLPFMNIHNPSDELGRRVLQRKIDEAEKENPHWSLGDVLDLIEALPEARYAKDTYGIRPKIQLGEPAFEASRVVFVHGALSAPHAEIVKFYWENGFRTVITLHSDSPNLELLLKEGRGNLVHTGHFLGDSLGMTPFIQAMRRQGLEVICMGGIIDVDAGEEGLSR